LGIYNGFIAPKHFQFKKIKNEDVLLKHPRFDF